MEIDVEKIRKKICEIRILLLHPESIEIPKILEFSYRATRYKSNHVATKFDRITVNVSLVPPSLRLAVHGTPQVSNNADCINHLAGGAGVLPRGAMEFPSKGQHTVGMSFLIARDASNALRHFVIQIGRFLGNEAVCGSGLPRFHQVIRLQRMNVRGD